MPALTLVFGEKTTSYLIYILCLNDLNANELETVDITISLVDIQMRTGAL